LAATIENVTAGFLAQARLAAPVRFGQNGRSSPSSRGEVATMREMLGPRITRRQLIKAFAAAGAATWMSSSSIGRALAAPPSPGAFHHFTAIAPSSRDELQVPEGYVSDLLIAWGDEFGDGLRFGYNADFTAYFPLRGPNEGILWVNHEYVIPYYTSDWRASQDPTWDPRMEPYRSIMAAEKEQVGGSLVHVRRDRGTGGWEVVAGSSYNRRFTAAAPPSPTTDRWRGAAWSPRRACSGAWRTAPAGSRPGERCCRRRRTTSRTG
jgi:secreted PhoX family phosphatase